MGDIYTRESIYGNPVPVQQEVNPADMADIGLGAIRSGVPSGFDATPPNPSSISPQQHAYDMSRMAQKEGIPDITEADIESAPPSRGFDPNAAVPVVVPSKGWRDPKTGEWFDNGEPAKTDQQRKDEYIQTIRDRVSRKVGIDIEGNPLMDAENKVFERWYNRAQERAASGLYHPQSDFGRGSFLNDPAYKTAVATAKAEAAQKLGVAKELVAQGIAQMEPRLKVGKDETSISPIGGPTYRGTHESGAGGIGYIFEGNKIIPLPGFAPKGTATEGAEANKAKLLEHDIHGVMAETFNKIAGTINEYAKQKAQLYKDAEILEKTGTPQAKAEAADKRAKADMATFFDTARKEGGDPEKVLKMMADRGFQRLFMTPEQAYELNSQITAITQRHAGAGVQPLPVTPGVPGVPANPASGRQFGNFGGRPVSFLRNQSTGKVIRESVQYLR